MKFQITVLITTMLSLSAIAAEKERDVLNCITESPISITNLQAEKFENFNKFTITQNDNSNYAKLLVDGKDIGTLAYSRAKGGGINPSGMGMSLSRISLNGLKDSGLLQSRRVALAYNKNAGKVFFNGGQEPVRVVCDMSFIVYNN